ncbi:MAG: hypothetical protein ACRDPJ_05880 [Nocardioidaceae bacterium]
MSDLQCAARFVVVDDVSDELLGQLRGERVAMVYDASADRPAGKAQVVAEALRVSARPLDRTIDVLELLARQPAAMDALRELADVHRGETVLVLAAGHATGVLEVSIDGDGVVVRLGT